MGTGPSNERLEPLGSWDHGLHKGFQAQATGRCSFRKVISYFKARAPSALRDGTEDEGEAWR